MSIVFGGDVMQHMPQINAARRGETYDYDPTFAHLKPYLDSADIAVFNLETTLATRDFSGYPHFSAPSQLAAALRACGVDAVTLANNHILDKGREGVVSTIGALDSAGLRHTGAFADSTAYRTNNPLMFDVRGVRIALFNYTYGLNGMPVRGGTVVNRIDTVRIASDLERAGELDPHVTIVCFHWGDEYTAVPNAAQRELSEWCRGRGVDFVIGSHPHVVQPVEVHRDSAGTPLGLTAYSLGNLVSNQRRRYRDGGILLRIDMEFRGSRMYGFGASCLPVWVHTPFAEGRKSYVILPPHTADTIPLNTTEREVYTTFISDTEKILGGYPPLVRAAPAAPVIPISRAGNPFCAAVSGFLDRLVSLYRTFPNAEATS